MIIMLFFGEIFDLIGIVPEAGALAAPTHIY